MQNGNSPTTISVPHAANIQFTPLEGGNIYAIRFAEARPVTLEMLECVQKSADQAVQGFGIKFVVLHPGLTMEEVRTDTIIKQVQLLENQCSALALMQSKPANEVALQLVSAVVALRRALRLLTDPEVIPFRKAENGNDSSNQG